MRRARWALGARLALWLLALGLLAAAPAARPPGPPGAPGRPALRWADRWLYDLRLRALAPPQADAQIVIIDIDERALAEHGRWPWRRALLADLLAQAAGPGGARLLGLDVVLAEPDRSPGLAALRPPIDDDARRAAVLQHAPVVPGFHLSNEPGAARIGQLPAPLLPTALLGDQADGLLRWAGHGGSVPALQAAAQLGAGHLNALIDSDGVVRRLPLLVAHDGGVHGTLALVMARALLAGPATSRAAADTGTDTDTGTGTGTATHRCTPCAAGSVAGCAAPCARWRWTSRCRRLDGLRGFRAGPCTRPPLAHRPARRQAPPGQSPALGSPARVVLRMQQPQPLSGHVGVNRGGADVGMAQQQLHRAQIGAVVQQVGGKGVAQGVR